MNNEVYDSLVSTFLIDKAIEESENEISSGAELVDAKEVFELIRKRN